MIQILLAKAQIRLAHWTLTAFVLLLGGLIAAIYFPAPGTLQQALITMLTGLTATLATILTLQMNYFFARHRPDNVPEPPGNGNGVPSAPVPPAITKVTTDEGATPHA